MSYIVAFLTPLLLLMGRSSQSNSQILGEIDSLHKVAAMGSDTVFFASSNENPRFEDDYGWGYALILKEGNRLQILDTVFFVDQNVILYKIADFDDNGENELLVIDADEAFYHAVIDKIHFVKAGAKVRKIFELGNIDIDRWTKASGIDQYVTLEWKANMIKAIRFHTVGPKGGPGVIVATYDKGEKRFRLK